MENTKLYSCSEFEESMSKNSIEEIFFLIKNDLLHTVRLKNGLEICQWHEINATVETRVGSVTMHFGDVYLTEGRNVIDKWGDYGEDAFRKWLEKCESMDVKGLSDALKKSDF